MGCVALMGSSLLGRPGEWAWCTPSSARVEEAGLTLMGAVCPVSSVLASCGPRGLLRLQCQPEALVQLAVCCQHEQLVLAASAFIGK